jgi:competence protein ComFC
MAKCNPRKIYGSWSDGYVLDLHSTGSTYIGDNEFGHPQFETHRTEIGELLFRLKYRSDETALMGLVEAASSFIRKWAVKPSIIVPVPLTRAYRKLQPVNSPCRGTWYPAKDTRGARRHSKTETILGIEECVRW